MPEKTPLWKDVLKSAAVALTPITIGLGILAITSSRVETSDAAAAAYGIGSMLVFMPLIFLVPAMAIQLVLRRKMYPERFARWYATVNAHQRGDDAQAWAKQLLTAAGATAQADDLVAVNATLDGLAVRVAATSRPDRFRAEVTGVFDQAVALAESGTPYHFVCTGDTALDSARKVGGGDAALAALTPRARELARELAPLHLKVEFGQVMATIEQAAQLHTMVSLAHALASRKPGVDALLAAAREDTDPGVRRAALLRLISSHRDASETREACFAALRGDDAISAAAAAIVVGHDPPAVDPAALEAASHALAPKERAALLELLAKAGAGAGQLALADSPAADAGALSMTADGGELSIAKTSSAKRQTTT